MATIKIDGQTIQLEDTTANSDEQLRMALTPFFPDAANSTFDRKQENGTLVVSVVKKAGTKGAGAGTGAGDELPTSAGAGTGVVAEHQSSQVKLWAALITGSNTQPGDGPGLNPVLALAWEIMQKYDGLTDQALLNDPAVELEAFESLQMDVILEGQSDWGRGLITGTFKTLVASEGSSAVSPRHLPVGF